MMYRCKICSEHYLSTEALQDHQFASHTQEALEAFGITKQSNTKTLSQEWQTRSNENKTEILHSLGYTPSDIQTLISLEFYQFGSKIKKEIGEALTKSTPITQKVQVVESDENKTYQNMYDSYLKSRSAQIKKPFQDGTESKASEAGLDDQSCPECGFITSDNSDYIDHLNAHGIASELKLPRQMDFQKGGYAGKNDWGGDATLCEICGTKFNTYPEFLDHYQSHAEAQGEDFYNEVKASEDIPSGDCPKCGHKKGSHSSPASGDTICYGSSDCPCSMTFQPEVEASETHIWGAWFSDNFKEEYTMDQDGTYRCRHCGAWFDMYQHSQEVAKYHLAEHGIVTGESKANENKTFTCDKCGKVGDSFSGMAQEECPADSPNNHQIPIFGDQVKPNPISRESEGTDHDNDGDIDSEDYLKSRDIAIKSNIEEAEEDDYEERAEWNWLTNKDQSPEAKATEDDYKYDFDELTSLAQDKIEDEGVTQKEWDETPEEERKDLEDSIGEALKSHTDYHKLINSTLSGETTIQCSKCTKKFKAQESLNIHYNDTHADSELKSLIGELKANEEIEYTGGDFCDKCGTEFEDKGECKKCSEESMVEDIIHKTDSGVDITHSQDEWCELCDEPTTSFEMSDDEYEEEVEDLMEEEGIDEITDLDEEEKKDFFEDVDDIKVTDEEELEGEEVDEDMTEEEELQQARENLAPLDKNQDEKSNVTKAFESGASVEDIYSKVGDTTQDRGSEDDLTDIYNKVDVKLNLEKY